MKRNYSFFKSLPVILFIFLCNLSFSQYVQDGNKLVGTGAVGVLSTQGKLSISSDGNTIAVGGYSDNGGQGAVWVFVKEFGNWIQQGNKLVGTGDTNNDAYQGRAVAIAGNGKTIITGGCRDDSFKGAAWIYTRSGNIWNQQGNKLVGTGANNFLSGAHQGIAVALSDDGNTAVIAGDEDSSGVGAVWIFTRIGNSWSQQGNKLVGTNIIGMAHFGSSVDISGDGNTVAIGGDDDDNGKGAIWVFVRSGNSWTQLGNKIVPFDNNGLSELGHSIAISADGNTIVAGGTKDNSYFGATWIFTKNGNVWSQQGNKLVGTNAINTPHCALQGTSVDISANGNRVIIGGEDDNNLAGAIWVFDRSANNWTQTGTKFSGTGASGFNSKQGSAVAISGNGNVISEGGMYDNSGIGATWVFNDTTSTLGIKKYDESKFKIYPNPSTGQFNFSDLERENSIEIYDLTGKRIYLIMTTENNQMIDLSEKDKGVYFYKITHSTKIVQQGKLILQ